jgi:hypothetical protein
MLEFVNFIKWANREDFESFLTNDRGCRTFANCMIACDFHLLFPIGDGLQPILSVTLIRNTGSSGKG